VQLKPVHYSKGDGSSMKDWRPTISDAPPAKKDTIGCDIFLHWSPKNGSAEDLGKAISNMNGDGMKLTLITNRGVKVWPNGFPETFCTDHWRLRFKSVDGEPIKHSQIISLLLRIRNAGFDFIKMENLYLMNGKPSFSQGQGE
jgi:isocitrate dehydrogenase